MSTARKFPPASPRRLSAAVAGARENAARRWEAFAAWRGRVDASLSALPGVRVVWSYVTGVTRLGWSVGVVGLAATVVGTWLRWAELLVIGVGALACLLLSLLWSAGRARYDVRLRLLKDRVTVGSRATGTLHVINRASTLVRSSLMDLPFGRGMASFRVPRLSRGAQHIEGFELPTQRRGVITIGPAEAVRGDPLGLVRRTTVWEETTQLYIHPQIVGLASQAIGFIRDVEGATVNQLSSSDVSFHALREYMPGDDRRNIHWPTTIRVGEWMVRQFEETRRAHLLVILDRNLASWGSEEAFEVGVSAAASLVAATLRDGKEVTIACQEATSQPRSAMRGLDFFAALEPGADLPELSALGRDAALVAPEASVVMVITGGNNSVDEVHRCLAVLPLSMAKAALRVDEGAELSVRTVDGFPVVTFPDRAELPRALKRAMQ
ncbi:MAG: DUF58 domain-containing protein [Buchananella hordeovulneris]|nr:DUF58 domain-containing protein [Buchananella hordeovulneris]